MRFLEKFDSWSWTCVDVLVLLIWCDVVRNLKFDPLILSRLDACAWFGGSGACDVLEIRVLEESFYLQRSFNIWGYEDGRLQELGSSLVSERILFRHFGVKNFQSPEMRRTPLFIEFFGKFYGLEPDSWAQPHEFELYLVFWLN